MTSVSAATRESCRRPKSPTGKCSSCDKGKHSCSFQLEVGKYREILTYGIQQHAQGDPTGKLFFFKNLIVLV